MALNLERMSIDGTYLALAFNVWSWPSLQAQNFVLYRLFDYLVQVRMLIKEHIIRKVRMELLCAMLLILLIEILILSW